MFVNTEAASNYRHKNGLCIEQRRAGYETLVQWSNGDRRWYHTADLQGKIVLVDPSQVGQSDG